MREARERKAGGSYLNFLRGHTEDQMDGYKAEWKEIGMIPMPTSAE
jgi:hypothetical protein